MSGKRDFCPRCGGPIPSGEGLPAESRRSAAEAELCRACYFEEFELVALPRELTLHVCAGCGAVRRDGDWTDVEEEDYTEMVLAELADAIQIHRDAAGVEWGVEPRQLGPNELELDVRIDAAVHGHHVGESHTVPARIAVETCQRCGRIAGNYYAGTVQIRADVRTPSAREIDRATEIAHEVVDRQRDTGNRTAFVTEVTERPEGVDIRVSTNRLGEQIAHRVIDEFGGRVRASETLVTEDADGERVYRVAFAVRLPRFRPGDIVESAGERGAVLIERVGETVHGRHLASGEEVVLDDAEIEQATRLATIDEANETTVVAVEDEHAIQVLDPDSHAAVTIPRPADFPESLDTVDVVRSADGLVVVPTW